ncbi:MAG: response regulator [Candidatus Omnitrophica bacterium]|nr:response regulator [Candidatus Omnitrophota bacterium]MDD5437357.1 response regulator [Candidatus Omnitrophota bacterium]
MSKILIVEDETDLVTFMTQRLVKEGFEVISAKDVYEAVELVRKAKPDLLILDLMLPAGGGLTVLKNLRADREYAHIPVVVLTASHSPGYKEEVLKEGVQAYLEKPYDSPKLIAAIKKALAGK